MVAKKGFFYEGYILLKTQRSKLCSVGDPLFCEFVEIQFSLNVQEQINRIQLNNEPYSVG